MSKTEIIVEHLSDIEEYSDITDDSDVSTKAINRLYILRTPNRVKSNQINIIWIQHASGTQSSNRLFTLACSLSASNYL